MGTIASVRNIEWAAGKKGNYQKVILVDENGGEVKFNVFNPEPQETIQQAFDNGLWVDAELEKNGKFLNLKNITLVKDAMPVPPEPKSLTEQAVEMGGTVIKTETKQDKMSKQDWADKDKVTRESIQCQTALNDATTYVCKVMEVTGKVVDLDGLDKAYYHFCELLP